MTLNTEHDRRYFTWLCSMVGVRPNGLSGELLTQFHNQPFTPVVERDENRYEDGLTLRRAFSFESDIHYVPVKWYTDECSFLEMMVALSERLGMHIDVDTPVAFWHLMRNLGLNKMSDIPDTEVEKIVDRINDRTFDRDGKGSLFPLRVATRDQRHIELYAQMQDYIMELDL